MLRLPKFINKTLSVRLSLMVVCAMTILLMATLTVMFYFSRKSMKEETLQEATQSLEGTVQRIDNVLLSVEQATGNMFLSVLPYLDRPDMVLTYARELVKANRYIDGCAIAFKPYYYKDREYCMTYVHLTAEDSLEYSDSPTIHAEYFGDCPYTEQEWFKESMTSFMPGWRMPQNKVDAHEKPFATFCITIPGIDGKPVGVMGVDVQTSLLSQIVLSAKPSPHFYSTLLSKDGSFIVHPDSSKLYHQTAFTQIGQDTDPAMKLAAEAMVKGDTGYRKFQMDGTDYYVFYKPFKRSAVPGRAQGETGWSVGIVYPEDDIFGDYNRLLYYVLIIAVAGLVLLFVLSRSIIHGQLLPLRVLTRSAQHIARGNYNELIPDSQQNDEIGQLQDIFQQMQQSLSVKTHEQERLITTLLKREDSLRVALNRAKKADGMKMAFLHNMTNQMIIPATAINEDVNALCHFDQCKNEEETNRKVDDIQRQGQTIANLLNELLHISEEETGKEARP